MSRSSTTSRRSRTEHLVVLAGYTLIALVMSYPLIAQFGDHIAGVDGDVWSYLWAMGWARTSLLDLGVNPFHTDYVFYPLGGATQLLWGTALPSFASIPLQLAFGLVPAFNLIYLASSVLTGYGTYLLAKQVLQTVSIPPKKSPSVLVRWIHPPAFLAGLVFAFGALRLGYGLAFTNLFHTEFIPFYLLFLLRATQRPGWRNAILAGIFFALNVYIDFQIAAFLAVLTGIWIFFILTRSIITRDPKGFLTISRQPQAITKNPSGLALTAQNLYLRWLTTTALALVLSLPMLAFILQDFSIEGGNYIRVYPLRFSAERSYDALAFVIPNVRSTLYSGLAPRIQGVNASVEIQGNAGLSPDRQSFLGVTVLVLALVGAIRFRRAMRFWILATLVFAVLSLGPVLHLAGSETNIPLPFVLANNIPILNHIRIPMRYGLMVFFGTALLAGAGAVVLLSARPWLFPVLGALLLIESAVLPYPTLEFRIPPVYQQIAQTPGDFTILEIPSFNWRHAAKNEAYQPIHRKRILRAYTNRIAPDVAEYFNLRQTPIIVRSLRILEGAEQAGFGPQEIDQDRAMRDETLQFFNLRYAILHRDQLTPEQSTNLDLYLREGLNAEVFYQDTELTAYQFAAQPDAPTRPLDFSNNNQLMYLGRGWQIEPLADADGAQGRYLNSDRAELYLSSRDSNLALSLRVLNTTNPTNLSFTLNNTPINTAALQQGWQTLTLTIQDLSPNILNLLQIRSSTPPDTIAVGAASK